MINTATLTVEWTDDLPSPYEDRKITVSTCGRTVVASGDLGKHMPPNAARAYAAALLEMIKQVERENW